MKKSEKYLDKKFTIIERIYKGTNKSEFIYDGDISYFVIVDGKKVFTQHSKNELAQSSYINKLCRNLELSEQTNSTEYSLTNTGNRLGFFRKILLYIRNFRKQ